MATQTKKANSGKPQASKEADTPIIKGQLPQREGRDWGGNRPGTRAHCINSVLLAAQQRGELHKLSVGMIDTLCNEGAEGKAYFKRTGKEVGAISNHIQALIRDGYVDRGGEGGGLRIIAPHAVPSKATTKGKRKKTK